MSRTLTPRPFGGLVELCAARNIGRSTAFELARRGLIETFKIGRRTYCYLDSLDTLGERLSTRPYDREDLA